MPLHKVMKFWKRVQLAWKVFKLEPFEMFVGEMQENGTVNAPECDGSWDSYGNFCKSGKRAKYCFSRQAVRFEVNKDEEHFHCCQDCRDMILSGRLKNVI